MIRLSFCFLSLLCQIGFAAAALDPKGCFYDVAPNCTVPPNFLVDSSINVDLVCLAMEVDYFQDPNKDDVSQHHEWLNQIDGSSYLCLAAEQVYHECYWCAKYVRKNVPNNYCQFENCAKPADFNLTLAEVNRTCAQMQKLFNAGLYPGSIDLCDRSAQASYACPMYCNQDYLGATTERKKKALPWMSRSAAFLSFIGASYILYDVLSNPKNRANTYHQLLGVMAIFDLSTAFAWSWGTWPIPSDKFWIYGASGTMGTCKMQAFFVQLGFTSVFYNVSLALYYLLIIVYDWREHSLKKISVYLHGIPLGVGVSLAFVGIPFYDWFEYGCHLLPPPAGPMWAVIVFAVVPLCVSIGSITTSMLIVYWKVRAQAKKAGKWRLGSGSANTLEREVFWQAFWYLLAFYVTWPILFAVYLASVDVGGPYAIAMMLAFVAPLQGWNNFLVYLRPKYNRYVKFLKKKRESKSSGASSSGASLWRRGLFGTSTSTSVVGASTRNLMGSSTRNLNDSQGLSVGQSRRNLMQSQQRGSGKTKGGSAKKLSAEDMAKQWGLQSSAPKPDMSKQWGLNQPSQTVSELSMPSGVENSTVEQSTAEMMDDEYDDDIDPSVAIAMDSRPPRNAGEKDDEEPKHFLVPPTIEEGDDKEEPDKVEQDQLIDVEHAPRHQGNGEMESVDEGNEEERFAEEY